MGFLVSVLINLPCVHEVVKARTRCTKAAAARVSSDMVLNLLSKMVCILKLGPSTMRVQLWIVSSEHICQVALVRISAEHAFGSAEIKQDLVVVPPNSIVFYEVERVSFENVCLKSLDLACLAWLLFLIRTCLHLYLLCRTKNHGI